MLENALIGLLLAKIFEIFFAKYLIIAIICYIIITIYAYAQNFE